MWRRALLLASTAVIGVHGNNGDMSVEPCAYIAALEREGALSFPARSAFDCLNSVPVDVEGDKKLIDQLKIVWQSHSDITWLKQPPLDWKVDHGHEPLDLIAELDKIKEDLGKFGSEYQVQLAIQELTVRTGNFHFNYRPDILNVFQWRRDVSLVALSDDGQKLPKLYVGADALKVADGYVQESKISDVAKINGEDAWKYLENLAEWEQYSDKDGRLNKLWAKGDSSSLGAFMDQSRFDLYETNITFANETTIEYMNTAWTLEEFKDVKDGKSFFDKFCDGQMIGARAEEIDIWKPEFHATSSSRPLRKRQHDTTRYPEAVVHAASGAVSGYFLEGDDYDDVAVLKIMSFAPDDDDVGIEFQKVVSEFLEECQTSNKSKLIIDLRENDGGHMHLMIDTFRQLFPHRVPFQGARYRANPHFKLIGDAFSEIRTNDKIIDYYQKTWNASLADHYRHWAYSHFLDAQNKQFESWEQLKGPERFNDDQYSKVVRYNLSNEESLSVLMGDFKFVDPAEQDTVFNHTEIVMFTDALCGSACAAFVEEMKNNAGVRSITVGGRRSEGPIQAVTGAKGGEVLPMLRAIEQADRMRNISRTFELKSYPAGEATLDELADAGQVKKRAGDDYSRIQAQVMMRKGDKTATPLQFIYEAADCRIFYTHESFAHPEIAYKQVMDAFNNKFRCVESSHSHRSSLSGGFQPYGPWTLKNEDLAIPQEERPNPSEKASAKGDEFEGSGSRMGVSTVALFLTAAAVLMQL